MKRILKGFKLHPLFLLFALYECGRGRGLSFLSVTIVALLHELGHSLYAQSIGFTLNQITLMPYGAVVSGDTHGMTKRETLLLCLAGPLTNGLICLSFTALWWVFPDTYPYTDTAVYSSAVVGLINLLPALPLDGGRALFVFFPRLIKGSTVVIAFLLVGLGLLFTNLSLCLFGLFLVTAREEKYERIDFTPRRGAIKKEVMIESSAKLKDLFRFLEEGKWLVFHVVRGGEELGTISQSNLYEICLEFTNNRSLYEIFEQNDLQKVQANGIISNDECYL